MLKYAHLKNSQLKIEYRRIYLLNANWITVFIIFAVGFLFQIVSLSFTYFVLLIPFISIFAMVAIFYTFRYEAQKVTDTDKIFFILCCLYFSTLYFIFSLLFCLAISSFVCLIVSAKVDSQRGEVGLDVVLMKFAPLSLGFFLISLIGFFALFFTIISFIKRFQNAIVCGSAPAFLQVLGFIFSKISIDLILKTIYSNSNQFQYVSTYIILLFGIICNGVSIHMLQLAFMHFEHRLYTKFASFFTFGTHFSIYTAIIIMIFHLIFSFSSIIASLFMFDEFEEMHLFQTILFLLCVIMQLFSIYSTVRSHANRASLYPTQQQSHEGSLVVISELEFENEMNDDVQNKEQQEDDDDEEFQEAQDIEERMV